MIKYLSQSVQDTRGIGVKCAELITPHSLVCLFGDLGSGKTTLIKSIIAQLTQINPHQITSPTFTYVNTYKGKAVCHHFDLYRLSGTGLFLQKGFDEYLDTDAYSMIEWPERIEPLLKNRPHVKVTLRTLNETEREITLEK